MTTKSDFRKNNGPGSCERRSSPVSRYRWPTPAGPIEAAKESMATIKSATNPPSREQLLAEVALDIQAQTQQRRTRSRASSRTRARCRASRCSRSSAPCRRSSQPRATPEETAAFGRWLLATAQAAADAAKEGGFMGFGAKQVSEGEQAMLDQVRDAVAT